MDELLDDLRCGLATGTLAPWGWNGVNRPGRLEQLSGLWVSHGTAWRYDAGTTDADYVNPLWEWAVVFEGGFVFSTAARTYAVAAPCCYIVPPGLRLGVQVEGPATLAAWFMVDGSLAGTAFAACGGHPNEITISTYTPAQAHHTLRIAQLLYERPPGFSTLLQAQLWAFLAAAAGAVAGDRRPIYTPEVERVLRYLDDHAHEEPIATATLAQLAALSPSAFRRRFTAEVGLPPRHYQLRGRLRRAKHLLMRDGASIKTVAHELGFRDQLYFSRLFTQYEGISPSEFRRRFALERASQRGRTSWHTAGAEEPHR